ncbi:Uncharacterized protein QJS10_CPB20g00327 [Acorus calamus]|uniref:Uncharacterized protein n=1 Tax=Acorus calamus TaxID=4465 RepID=A0AAV9C9T6_ACOCL|nr:Uncharacterized protein QJS10_CPB20g00327 [Acorus calamus]
MLAQQMGSRDRSMSLADVNYSCGSCGYALNLSSSNRNTSKIDSKYGKAIKKGIISFFPLMKEDSLRLMSLHAYPISSQWAHFAGGRIFYVANAEVILVMPMKRLHPIPCLTIRILVQAMGTVFAGNTI